jgi:hypothetical protein
MAVTDSREVVIEATPAEILDVLADVARTPEWSPQHQSAEIVETFDNGRPKVVTSKVKAAGITDEQTIEYTWSDTDVKWTLVKASALKGQTASYTMIPEGDKTRVKFEVSVDLSIPLPGFVVKKTMKGALETATDGLRSQVLKVKKGG